LDSVDDQGASLSPLLPFFVRQEESFSMRKSQLSFSVVIAAALVMAPQFAEAGPCSSDIAELETAIQQPGVNLLSGPGRQSVDPQRSHQPTPELARQLHSQFSATVARAKRLDTKGQRIGCIGAINAARRMYVPVDKQ
jgi:hypothetical protein